jgi:ubiquitin fusion degradation protein 1
MNYQRMNPPQYGTQFSHSYKILPASRDQEGTGMIVLCRSALEKISVLELQYPLMFQIQNKKAHPPKILTCGVQDFTAPEGVAYVPKWMMRNLGLHDNSDTNNQNAGDIATITSVTLPSATFIQLQPQSVAFLNISNPKAVLEQVLRKYPTLTKGSTVLFYYNDKEHYMKVLDIKPMTSSNAVSIINADVEVDFAPPVGYVEPERPKPKVIEDEIEEEDPLQTSYSSFSEESSDEETDAFEQTVVGKGLLGQLSAKKKQKLVPIISENGAIEYKGESDVNELRDSLKKEQKAREDKIRKEEEEKKKKEEESKKNLLTFSGKGDTIR